MISIIIPAYNVNQYIEQCIDSLINIEKIEILLIDDGSPEDLSFVKEKYNKYNNFNYYKKENGGLSDARNYGIKKATKEYIMFLDGDDFVDTNKLQESINIIKETKREAYYFKYMEYFETDKKTINERDYIYDQEEYISVENKEFIKNPFVMVAWRYIVKREIILNNNLFFTKGIYHEDEDWTPKLFLVVDKIYSLNSYLLFYRQREDSIMATKKYKNITDTFKIINFLYEYKRGASTLNQRKFLEIKRLNLYRGLFFVANIVSLSNEEKKQVIKKLKDTKETIVFNNKLKNRIVKYCPVEILLFLQKIRSIIKQ